MNVLSQLKPSQLSALKPVRSVPIDGRPRAKTKFYKLNEVQVSINLPLRRLMTDLLPIRPSRSRQIMRWPQARLSPPVPNRLTPKGRKPQRLAGQCESLCSTKIITLKNQGALTGCLMMTRRLSVSTLVLGKYLVPDGYTTQFKES